MGYFFFVLLRRVVLLRAVVFFAPPLRLVVERDLLVPELDRARLVPEVDFARLVPAVDFARVVPEVDRARLVPDVDREDVERELVERFAAVARPPLRPAAAFCAFVPPRDDVERELVEAERDLEVPEVERARDVPVLEPDRELVDRDEDVDRLAAVARPPLRPAAAFCAFVPPREDVERELVEAARDLEVPEAEPERELVDREVVDRLAAVARPPLRPAAFFWAVVPPRPDVDRDVPVERLRLVVDRAELRDVPDFERVVPEVDRERLPLVERRGDAALARETASSPDSSATDSAPKRSGIKPGLLTDSGGKVCSPVDSSGLLSSSGSGV